MPRPKGHKETFAVVPEPAARRGETRGQQRTRRVAEMLGLVAGDSVTRSERGPVAWAYDVRSQPTDNTAWIVAGARGRTRILVARVAEEEAFSGMRAAKLLAAEKTVEGVAAGARVPALRDVDNVLFVKLRPVFDLSLLERCLDRLARIIELDGPEIIMARDKIMIHEEHARLCAAGWTAEAQPLAASRAETLARVLAEARPKLDDDD